MALFGAAVLLAAPPAENSYVASLRRLTEQEYRNSITDIFGKDVVVAARLNRASGSAA